MVDRWSEHGDEYGDDGEAAAPGPDGLRHIHVEYEDGACVCLVLSEDGAESVTSNRLFVPIEGTDAVTLGPPVRSQGD